MPTTTAANPIYMPKSPDDLEARLAEYTAVVRLLFDDAIAHNMHTKSVEIAGRLLYSQNHADLAKYFVQKGKLS